MSSKDDAAESSVRYLTYPPAKSTDIKRTVKFSSLWPGPGSQCETVFASDNCLSLTEYVQGL